MSDPLTHREASHALREGEAQLDQARETDNTALHIDCAGLSQVDSLALTVLLSWQRTAQDADVTLDITGAPQTLSNLATLYGLESLLVIVPILATHHRARH